MSLKSCVGGVMRDRKSEGEHLIISEVEGRVETLFVPTPTTIRNPKFVMGNYALAT